MPGVSVFSQVRTAGRGYLVVVRTPRRSAGTALAIAGLVVMLAISAALNPAAGAGSQPGASAKAGSCSGFKNRVGMTSKVIRIGNASDLSGPVPGLYTAAQQATRAYLASFNYKHRVCGRRLVLDSYDSRTDAGADRAAYKTMCGKDFVAIGSMSGFDNGGAATAQACKLPDVRATSVTAARNACTSCFGVEASRVTEGPSSEPDFFVHNYATASQHAAFLYLNAGASAEHAKYAQSVDTKRGMHFVYSSGIDVADFNYGPYVQAMKSALVQWVQFIGPYQDAVRLAQAMQNGGFHPQVAFYTPSVYTPGFASTGGAAVEGSITAINSLPLGIDQAELNRYRFWLHQLYPGAPLTEEGLYAWSAAKLFTTEAVQLGARLSRISLNARLRTVTGWTGGGMHAPMAVGAKHPSPCVRFLQLHNGAWVSLGGTAYRCNGVTTVH